MLGPHQIELAFPLTGFFHVTNEDQRDPLIEFPPLQAAHPPRAYLGTVLLANSSADGPTPCKNSPDRAQSRFRCGWLFSHYP